MAALVGAEPRNVVFTSGGTEANALALTPAIQTGSTPAPRDRLLVSAIEHPSVRAGGRFPPDLREDVPVTREGMVDLAKLAGRLEALTGTRPLVSVMLANNETGVIQPIVAVAGLVHAAGGLLHVDAVQAVGKIPCDINALGADLLTLSAHKLGGPQGVGALVLASESLHIADQLLKGGGQERGSRAGTENVIGIVGFGAAAEAIQCAGAAEATRIERLRDRPRSRLAGDIPRRGHFRCGRPAAAEYDAGCAGWSEGRNGADRA